jgi:hypothetical protein
MKRIIFLLMSLLVIIAIPAKATVIDVVGVDIGQSEGRMGTLTDPLEPNDTIGIKIVLRTNPYYPPGYPEYQGYTLCSADLDLEITGPGCLDAAEKDKQGNPVIHSHPDIYAYNWSGLDCNGIDYMQMETLGDGISSLSGDVDLVWGLLLHCKANGLVLADLGLHGSSEYNEYAGPGACDYPLPLTDPDLGDLDIYQGPPAWPDCWNWPGQCHGDAVGNNLVVDLTDFMAFKEAFGCTYPEPCYDPCVDFDRDGDIDLADFLVFQDGFKAETVPGDCPPGGTWPPEYM